MAIWQFETELIPSERIGIRDEVCRAAYDEGTFWSDRQPPGDYRDKLAVLLKPVASWSDQLLWFGAEGGDRIDVWIEGGLVESISFRIDCREANIEFVTGILRLADAWSARLFETRYLKVLPTDLRGFVSAIANSPNSRFVCDPEYWLPRLADEVRDLEDDIRPD